MSKASDLRARYAIHGAAHGLARADLDADPLAQFGIWLKQAEAAGIAEPNAMVLATATAAARPSQRSVLLKGCDADGFVFFTNHGSRKAAQMRENDAVAAVFAWHALHRQVHIEGRVEGIAEAQSEAYFHSRPRQAQLGAWASRQSAELASRGELEQRMRETTARFDGKQVPLPPFWGGYRLRPRRMEFWQGRNHRLHDRILYTREGQAPWQITRLSP